MADRRRLPRRLNRWSRLGVDPTGRSLGAFFADEVAAPLDIEFSIGVPPAAGTVRFSDNSRAADPFRLLAEICWPTGIACASTWAMIPRLMTSPSRSVPSACATIPA